MSLMQAALLTAVGQPLDVRAIERPAIGPDEALVETRTCGVCRTDLHIQDGLAYVPILPHIPGHEPAGVVVAVGANVRNVRVGDRVTPHLFVRERECAYSRAGHDAQALHLKGILGVTLPGGFAEYFAAPAENLLLIPAGVPFEAAGLTSCAVITAVHAFRVSGLRAGDTAVVLGAGGIGQVLVQLLVHSGVRTAVVSRSPTSRDLATAAGATAAWPFDDPGTADEARRFSEDGAGVDGVFELVGLAGTMRLASEMVRPRGTIVVIGEEAEHPAIDTIRIAQRELRIIGSRNGSRQDARDALDLLSNGALRPPIAARYSLTRINEALDLVRGGGVTGRVVITLRDD